MKRAFTLAEVLITLTIIGVVAAMTMPVLINKHRQHEYVVRLKKVYTNLEEGFQRLIINNGCEGNYDALECTGLWGNGISLANTEYREKMINELKKVFNITEVQWCDSTNTIKLCTKPRFLLTGQAESETWARNRLAFTTTDGYVFYIQRVYCIDNTNKSNKYAKDCGWIAIDTNGLKGPNVQGRDDFEFIQTQSGNLITPLGSDYAYAAFGSSWQTSTAYWKNAPGSGCGYPDKTPSEYNGGIVGNCAARIIENGWKMDY